MTVEIMNDLATMADKDTELTMDEKDNLRDKIAELEAFLITQPQIEEVLNHNFSPGVYARELFIPKGAVVVGKIHKKTNMNIISKGEVTFFSTDGAKHVDAPYTFVANPGVKRVIYAHSDTIWTTIHGTNETDLEKLEEEFIAKDYSEIKEEQILIKGE